MAVPRAELATSFGAAAETYDRYRPAPPAAVAEWLLPPGARRVADVAAGTGGFTRVLAARVDEVVAVELDRRMAARLATRSPGAAVVNGRGEVLPFRTGSLDAVLVSAAWHWLDHDRAVPEMARVLRPGGVLGVVWNSPRRSVDWVRELLSRGVDGVPEPDRSHRRLDIPQGVPFEEPESMELEWSLPRTPAELVGLAGTYSRVITLTTEEREAVSDRAARLVASHPSLRDREVLDLPMTARAWRAVRRA